MGIGVGMGIPAPLVAGAVVTGASFGDKLSPLSDSTNLAAATAEAGLFDHVRHMLKTKLLLVNNAALSLRLCVMKLMLQKKNC